ncbi:ATP synthase subunit C [Entomospira entomophila]|uniref:ATP synthase F(0) sector subunit c n=1 Tax=Entomospira entomophila TaxID=2719988 RepID=A0A968G9J8_9SPIO|nr:ATP synthase subunit C [Entomospira entomophilus]NIZ40432.1 ATPase [Entomospira entomophilus]WDI35990.1 ATP synthase subunit C [Entomospira entomophilus]
MNSVQKKFAWVSGSSFLLITMLAMGMFFFNGHALGAQASTEDQTIAVVDEPSSSDGLGLVGAGLAFGLAALGAGIAVASVGAAALGVLSEKPQMLGQAFMFVALGEGIVIFGFVMAFMIMNS